MLILWKVYMLSSSKPQGSLGPLAQLFHIFCSKELPLLSVCSVPYYTGYVIYIISFVFTTTLKG